MDNEKVIKRLESQKRANKKYQKSQKGKEAKKRYENSPSGKEKRAKAMYRYTQLSPRGKARNIISKMKTSSIKRGHEWSDTWWSIDMVQEIIEKGKCAKSGIPFKLKLNAESEKNSKNPFGPSPDRIDNTKGYEPDNVQWVVWIFNVMKNTFKEEEVDLFINALKENYK